MWLGCNVSQMQKLVIYRAAMHLRLVFSAATTARSNNPESGHLVAQAI